MTDQDPVHIASPCAVPQAHVLASLRILCLAEAATLLALLFVAVPLKHLGGYSLAVSVAGPVHGFAFLAFIWSLIRAITSGDISKKQGGRILAAAFVPFGGLYSWSALR